MCMQLSAPKIDFSRNDPTTIAIRTVTEFLSVVFSLVCFSRLGAYEYYYYIVQYNNTTGVAVPEYRNSHEPSVAANLVLFVTLVVFQFPFMNGYILFMYDRCVIGGWHPMRVMLCFWLVGVQVLGVGVAWAIIRWLEGAWQDTIIWIAPQGAATDAGMKMEAEFLEEFVAVTALLVGYIHLVYLNFKSEKFNLFGSEEHYFAPFSETTKKLAIPMAFMVQVTLLVAGLLRCFPTAHLSPHISCYLLMMQYTTWQRFGYRMLGGVLAFGATWLLFWFGYDKRTQAHPEKPYKLRRTDTAASAGREESVHAHLIGQTVPTWESPVMGDQKAISFNNPYRHAGVSPVATHEESVRCC